VKNEIVVYSETAEVGMMIVVTSRLRSMILVKTRNRLIAAFVINGSVEQN
jgi:hypothetical protein